MSAPRVIGWREWVALPEWGVPLILAKMDTGARSCTVHATQVRVAGAPGDGGTVRFRLHPWRREPQRAVEVEAPLVDVRRVKSSVGTVTERPVVRTAIFLAGARFEVEVTLVDRASMGYRMLVGRAALRKRFAVDPARSFTAGSFRDHKSGRAGKQD
ncbi:MAG: ATP-dependent zinc protease [Bdellovibrionales bacterium]|nr:ATP-dependent zinc protease [Bdellovibrionales bacterium]